MVRSRKGSWEAGVPSEGTLRKALWPLLGCEGELGHWQGAGRKQHWRESEVDQDGFRAFLIASIPSQPGSLSP